MRSAKYLDQLKQEKNLKNDVALCKELGWSSARMSQYRSGKNIMDNEACIALAIALNIDPMKIIMECDIDRAEKSGQKSLWEVFMMRTQTIKTAGVSALLCLVFVTNLLTVPEAKAAPALGFQSDRANVDFILCQIKEKDFAENLKRI